MNYRSSSELVPLHYGLIHEPDFDMGAYEATADKAKLMILPRVINRYSRQRRVLAWLCLLKGITKDQIDRDTPLVLYPGGIGAIRQFVFQPRRRQQQTSVLAFFDKADLMAAVPENGKVQLHVLGQYIDPGQYFYGSDTIRIKRMNWKPWWHRHRQ